MFQKLNSIDTKIKDSVFGYIRCQGKQLSLRNVPALISYIALNYYYHNEYFAKYGQQVQLSNNNMTITKQEILEDKEDIDNTTYGNTWIDSVIPQIVSWRLQMSVDNHILFGLFSKDIRIDEDCVFDDDDKPFYAFENDGTLSYEDGNGTECETDNYNWSELLEDQWSLILNTEDKTISLQKDKSSEIIAIYENIQTGNSIKYKLGINLYEKDDNVSLIDFDLSVQ